MLTVPVAANDDFDGWRHAARRLLLAGIAPDQVQWRTPDSASADLFAAPPTPLPDPHPLADPPRVPRAFVDLAGMAALHCDPARFDLLYRLLWRLQQSPRLIDDRADPDMRAADQLARAVRRDIHKMRAFVRFRVVDNDHHIAWFEPQHHILAANAGFFVRRFAGMRWSILTPAGALHWDGEALQHGPPATRADAPSGDPAEDLWRTYYAAIFNPARLKVDAMVKEMPRRYWKNLPEAELIPDLIATAQAREAAMIALGSETAGQAPPTLDALSEAVASCRRCAIGCNGTKAVHGSGPADAALLIVGEQPGDVEEREGRPFIGPAGQVLRNAAAQAGLDLSQARLTNAVRHFRHELRGKVRLHQTPRPGEIDTCRWWLDAERALVRPRLVLALGTSAARGLLGRSVSIARERGQWNTLDDGADLLITAHPAHILRLDDVAQQTARAALVADLAQVAERLQKAAQLVQS